MNQGFRLPLVIRLPPHVQGRHRRVDLRTRNSMPSSGGCAPLKGFYKDYRGFRIQGLGFRA